AAVSSSAPEMSTATTLAPSRARRSAVGRPCPFPAPAAKATCPCRLGNWPPLLPRAASSAVVPAAAPRPSARATAGPGPRPLRGCPPRLEVGLHGPLGPLQPVVGVVGVDDRHLVAVAEDLEHLHALGTGRVVVRVPGLHGEGVAGPQAFLAHEADD